MSAPGLIWMPGDELLPDAWIHDRMLARFGAALVGSYIGADHTVNGSNQLTAWPARVGGNAAAGAQLCTSQLINGRRFAFNDSVAAVSAMGATLGTAARAVIAVLRPSALPFNNYRGAALIGTDGYGIAGNDGSSNYASSNVWGPGLLQYINGAASVTATTNLHVAEFDRANAITTINLMGTVISGVAGNWLGYLGDVFYVSRSITADERAGYMADLRVYHRNGFA